MSRLHPAKRRMFATLGRQVLAERFPLCFAPQGAPKRPLKVGIYADIRAAVPDLSSRKLVCALRDYTAGPLYLRGLVAGATRVGLDGEPAGEVTAEEEAKARAALARINNRHGLQKRRLRDAV